MRLGIIIHTKNYTYEEFRYRVKLDAADRIWQMMKLCTTSRITAAAL